MSVSNDHERIRIAPNSSATARITIRPVAAKLRAHCSELKSDIITAPASLSKAPHLPIEQATRSTYQSQDRQSARPHQTTVVAPRARGAKENIFAKGAGQAISENTK
jgi:hypothetical protein